MIKLLIIGHVWPEPCSSAAGSRMLQLIGAFREQGWAITFASPAKDSKYMTDLGQHGVRKVSIELNDSSFDDFIAETRPDIVVFDRFMIEEQFGWRVSKHCPQALLVLETVDLHCLRDAREKAHKDGRQPGQADLFSDLAKREIASIFRCDLSLVISKKEIELLIGIYKVDSGLIHHVPFMPEPLGRQTTDAWRTFHDRNHFISIGNFRHAPNMDAVLYLKEDIWPGIRAQLPDAELHVYGAYPPSKLAQLNEPSQGFCIKGRADRSREVMEKARVCLAPLRFGAGIKGKLIEAMICGTPSVTTSTGAESMHADLPWNGCIRDNPDDFIQAAVNLYQHKSEWYAAQGNGIAIINNVYNFVDHGQVLVDKINIIRDDLDNHRRNNFTGAMLKYHLLKSTEYMSRWIEAKNKY